jgi:hypothetical protein
VCPRPPRSIIGDESCLSGLDIYETSFLGSIFSFPQSILYHIGWTGMPEGVTGGILNVFTKNPFSNLKVHALMSLQCDAGEYVISVAMARPPYR